MLPRSHTLNRTQRAIRLDRELFDSLGLKGADRRNTDAVLAAFTRAAGRRTRAFERTRT